MMSNEENKNGLTRASLELLFNISHEVATVLDLPTVLERVLSLSMHTIGANSGTIIVLDDQGNPIDSTIIYGSEVFDHTTQQLKGIIDNGLAGWVVKKRQAALIPDTSKDDRWLRRPDDAEDATGAKSAVSAPLEAQERLVGVITLVQPGPNHFDKDHLSLVQTIANQASIAVLNARLYQESQRQARVMTALAESAAIINASLKFDDVIQRILQQIIKGLDVKAVSLALIDTNTKEIEFKASTCKDETDLVGKRFKMGQGIAGWVAREGRDIIIPDANKDPRFSPIIDNLSGLETASIACAPIRSRGEVIGILEAINPKEKQFDPDALLVLRGIGSLAGSALRNAQLYEYLEAAQQRYYDLFEESADNILITDMQGRIIEANKQSTITTEYDKDTLHKLDINQLYQQNPDLLGKNFENVQAKETISFESVLYAKNGEQIPIQVFSHLVTIDGIPHLQWIFRDISEQKNLDQMRDDLISMIYHDLRSPLSNIVSSLDVLSSMLDIESDSAIKSIFMIALHSTERIQRLTNSLLDINRLEAGQPITNQQVLVVSEIIQEALEATSPLARNKNQDFEIKIQEELPNILVDKNMIRRVLINLIENAIKFAPAKSKITLGAETKDEWVHVWIKDRGPGIPDEDKSHIFDKYTRLSSQHVNQGLGLGLAFCRLAIIGHGGRIWITDAEENGSIFHITLPIATI
ncbi:MAG: GAF domain-containing protein [Anaerolineales bacterium]|nr:GAF domain-containing protein [Anaerolineales bacterium]